MALSLFGASPLNAQTPCVLEQDKLVASDGAAADQFGSSTALDADTALVGAWMDNVGAATNAGSAYVFTRSGTNWVEQAHLVASDADSNDGFGISVALQGERAVIGSYFASGLAGAFAGAVYVFDRTGTVWSETQILTGSDQEGSDFFGRSVAIDGTSICVGGVGDDNSTGDAYVFILVGTSWVEEQRLIAVDRVTGDEFGYAVDIDGDYIVVGARRRDDAGTDSGSAYVFMRSGGAWSQQQKLVPFDGMSLDEYGNSVAISGDTIAVGSPCDDDNGASSGSTYTYTRTGTVWSLQQKLTASDGAASDQFGLGVDILGDALVTGAFGDDDVGNEAGSAYLFQRNGTVWSEVQKYFASDAARADLFGESVSLDANHILVSSRLEDQVAMSAGAAYVYDRVDLPVTYCTGKTTSLGCVPFLTTSGVPNATAGPFNVIVDNLVEGETGLYLYGFSKGSLAFHGGTLCVKAPFVRLSSLIKFTDGLACTGCAQPTCRMAKRNFNQLIQSGLDPLLTPGQRVNVQFRQRDVMASFGDNLSDGVSFVICP
jgi:hypothetical protein